MKTLVANLLLALLWIALTGSVTGANLLLGFGVGYLVLRVAQKSHQRSAYFKKFPEAIGFLAFFAKQLVVSSLMVAHDIVTPRHRMRPAIIAVPLDLKTDLEITLLGCLVSLTPGTLTLDVSPDRSVLFVHAMYVDDCDDARAAIKEGFEQRISKLLR